MSGSARSIEASIDYLRTHWKTCRCARWEKESDIAWLEQHQGKEYAAQVRARLTKELAHDEPKPSLI